MLSDSGVHSVNYPWNEYDMNLDVDGTIKVLKAAKPKVAQFGLSVFLFPPPLKELEDTFNEIDCLVWEDIPIYAARPVFLSIFWQRYNFFVKSEQ